MSSKCCGMNPRIGVGLIILLGLIVHGVILAWGVYANKTLYIMIAAGVTVLFYVYLFLPLGIRRHHAYFPFLVFSLTLILSLIGHLGFLIYVQIQQPDYWKTFLIRMLSGIVKDDQYDYYLINYVYMGVILILMFVNVLAYVTAYLAFRYERSRFQQTLILGTTSTSVVNSTQPYTTLDAADGQQFWNLKL
ncbi:hypothetical protein M3Y95_00905400 [Aphelenchoides besseyi]|nr:hypothetical protein M3Y95_00905400 [Aphelenchoides besseyi]